MVRERGKGFSEGFILLILGGGARDGRVREGVNLSGDG
jgi:hypothetical protein